VSREGQERTLRQYSGDGIELLGLGNQARHTRFILDDRICVQDERVDSFGGCCCRGGSGSIVGRDGGGGARRVNRRVDVFRDGVHGVGIPM